MNRGVAGGGIQLSQVYKSLPFYAGWFDFDKVHQIERQNLPEFFGEKPSKRSRLYHRMRNFMIQLYWKSPRVYLSATTARRAVAGDVSGVHRVHAFLESWGLINTQTSKARPANAFESKAFEFPQFAPPKQSPGRPISTSEKTFAGGGRFSGPSRASSDHRLLACWARYRR